MFGAFFRASLELNLVYLAWGFYNPNIFKFNLILMKFFRKVYSGKNFIAAAFLLTLILTGCQNVQDKIAQTVAEKAIENATGGKVNIDSDGGMTIKTKDGSMQISSDDQNGSIKINSNEGEAVLGGGSTRPDSATADLPSLPGAVDFSWIGSKDSGMLSFAVNGDYKTVCNQELVLLTGAGWKLSDEFVMELDGSIVKSLEMPGFSLSLQCATNEEQKNSTVVLVKSKA